MQNSNRPESHPIQLPPSATIVGNQCPATQPEPWVGSVGLSAPLLPEAGAAPGGWGPGTGLCPGLLLLSQRTCLHTSPPEPPWSPSKGRPGGQPGARVLLGGTHPGEAETVAGRHTHTDARRRLEEKLEIWIFMRTVLMFKTLREPQPKPKLDECPHKLCLWAPTRAP